ncbi:C6 finger domain protein [Aspergillus luchuensis]|uniref:C6 finger domain protein n=1 Tax=Aspergillus kawachii TaxID=1069201 RepID=A0A146FLF0_ASPKA|nr:C6 finger domain protein [Aspergillus luchuensis]
MSSGDGARNNPPEASGAAKAGSRKKIRPTYSCLNCHKRKVKPCGACCLRGTPSECEYGTSKRDRHYIQQSALIENLLRSCENLKQQLAEARQLANLPAIKDEDGSLPSSQALYSIKESDNSVEDGDDSLDELDLSSKAADNQSLASPNTVALEEQRTRKETNALIEFYVERLVTDFSPPQVSGTIALREARSLRVFSPILCSAFEAASLTFAGRRDGNRSVEVAGHSRYLRVLRSLQHALYDPQQGKSTEVLVVVLLATIIEVTAALVHRKPTFLAEKDWLTVPWPGDGPAKDILQRLLDVAVHIPGYLAQVDEFSALLKGGNKPPSELVNMQSAIWERATELQGLLQVWKNMYADTYPSGGPWEESPSEADPTDDFPKFRCRNPSTMQVIVGQNIMYPDLLLATSMTFYWALGLIISTTDPGLVSVLGLQERYQYACNICRSMKYYTQNIPGCLISRVMFILRTAFDNFADGMVEKESMAEIFTYIGRKFELPVFSNKCTSSSVKGEGKP